MRKQVTAWQHTCDHCQHSWLTVQAHPSCCAKCHRRTWNSLSEAKLSGMSGVDRLMSNRGERNPMKPKG